MAERRLSKKFWIGAAVGGAVGAAAGLLFAPKAGKELRQDIAKGVDQAVEGTKDAAVAIGGKTKEIASAIGEKTSGIAHSVGEHTSMWIGRAKDVAGAVAEEVRSWKNDRTDLPEIQTEASLNKSESLQESVRVEDELELVNTK